MYFQSGYLQKIGAGKNFIQTRVGGFSDKLAPDEIGIREDILEGIGLHTPLKAYYEPEGPRKPFFFDDERRHRVIDPKGRVDSQHLPHMAKGCAVISENDPYIEEIYKNCKDGDDYIVLNLSEIPGEIENFSGV